MYPARATNDDYYENWKKLILDVVNLTQRKVVSNFKEKI